MDQQSSITLLSSTIKKLCLKKNEFEKYEIIVKAFLKLTKSKTGMLYLSSDKESKILYESKKELSKEFIPYLKSITHIRKVKKIKKKLLFVFPCTDKIYLFILSTYDIKIPESINTILLPFLKLYLNQYSEKERLKDHLSKMFHDLKTPLTTISGYTQLLQMKSDSFSDSQKKYLLKISKEVKKIEELISTSLKKEF